MDEDEFWEIVEAAKRVGAGFDDTFVGREEELARQLQALPPERVVAFQARFCALVRRAHRYDLWGAALMLNDGGCSDDCFTDFRGWLISMGRERYEGALSDPDSLADVRFGPGHEQDAAFEGFAYVANAAYRAKTGTSLPELPELGDPRRREPAGRRWTHEELPQLLPRLHAAMKSG